MRADGVAARGDVQCAFFSRAPLLRGEGGVRGFILECRAHDRRRAMPLTRNS